MYIKLGNITVNRQQRIDDFMIFMEVVDSAMSFEHPVFVRNSEQLDIWFGKTFSDRDYFEELLNRGVSLYLYKPISKESDFPDYINLNEYKEYSEEVLYYSVQELPRTIISDTTKYNVNGEYYVYLPEIQDYVPLREIGKYIDRPREYTAQYRVREFATPSSLPSSGEPGIKYKVLDPEVWYIWLDSWVSETELPQNLVNESISLNNRDVLALTDPDIENLPKYFYPEYSEYEKTIGFFGKRKDLPEIVIENNSAYYNLGNNHLVPVDIDSDKIQEGLTTLSQRETYSGDSNGSISSGFQLIQDISLDHSGNTVVTRETGPIIYDNIVLPGTLYSKRVYISSIYELKNALEDCKYKVDTIVPGKEISVYHYSQFDMTYFNTLKEITVTSDNDLNNSLMSQMFMPFVNLKMWSKTIGRDRDDYSEEKNIKIKIDKIGTYDYRVIISRYDYSESFEGSLFPEPGESRIDDLITVGSDLVYCDIEPGTEALQVGEFTLRGAKIETYNKEAYWRSVEVLKSEEIYPDYFLIPDIKKYVNNLDKDYSYYIEYETFLDIAKELNCQVLIQNSDSIYKLKEVGALPSICEENTVYKYNNNYYLNNEKLTDQYLISLAEAGNDYLFNYTKDKENRLVYFFRDMTSYTVARPGYYIYLSGLLDNIYSASPDDILYNSPVTYPYDLDLKVVQVDELPNRPKEDTVYIIGENYYLGPDLIDDSKLVAAVNDEVIKESLSKYKSNYLVYNNQIYYYRGYENGEDYETTAWMRFAIGKIYRELQKNKWSYLSLKNVGKIRENIVAVLSRITRSFSVVNSINIALFKPVMNENRIELTLEVGVADVVENNIVLDLTINYNKEN